MKSLLQCLSPELRHPHQLFLSALPPCCLIVAPLLRCSGLHLYLWSWQGARQDIYHVMICQAKLPQLPKSARLCPGMLLGYVLLLAGRVRTAQGFPSEDS